jgi:opacity protein-like surface antigen
MRSFVSAVIATATCASLALAQTRVGVKSAATAPAAGGSEFALDGSLGFVAPDFGDANLGFDLMGAGEFHPKTLPVAFRGEIGWDYFGYGSSNLYGVGYSAHSNILRFDADALYDIPVHWSSKLQPYLLGGLGLYHVSVNVSCTNAACAGGASDTNLGINLGGGLRYPFGPVDGFFELRWHEAFAAGDAAFFPFQFGVRYAIPK